MSVESLIKPGMRGRMASVPSPLKHWKLQSNQDAMHTYKVYNPDQSMDFSMAIADGCTMSSMSGHAANETVQEVSRIVAKLVIEYNYDMYKVATLLHPRIKDYHRRRIETLEGGPLYLALLEEEKETGRPMSIDNTTREIYDWIQDNLMYTLGGGYFATNPNIDTLIYFRGDGGFALGNKDDQGGEQDFEITKFEYNDVAPYIGYYFLPPHKYAQKLSELNKELMEEKGVTVEHPEPGFSISIAKANKRVALFTDGFPEYLLKDTWGMTNLPQQWDNKPNPLFAYLQDLFLQCKPQKQQGPISDDCSVIVFTNY